MNKQIGYITSAHLILISVAASYFFISKISSVSADHHPRAYYPVSNQKTLVLSAGAAKGKILFISKCAACHAIFKDMIGPGLSGAIASERWTDRSQLYKWIRNPEAFMKTNAYTRELRKMYGSMMQAFPDLTDENIDAIVEYIKESTSVSGY